MITEDYVSFEIAKLLKEKGFDEKCFQYWHEKDNELVHSQSPHPIRNITNPCFFGPAAPTLQMAMKWLREERDVGIFPSVATYTDGDKIINGYRTIVVTLKNRITKSYHYAKTYEEAADAALKYSLENLI